MVTIGLKALKILKKKNVLIRARIIIMIIRIFESKWNGPLTFWQMTFPIEDQM